MHNYPIKTFPHVKRNYVDAALDQMKRPVPRTVKRRRMIEMFEQSKLNMTDNQSKSNDTDIHQDDGEIMIAPLVQHKDDD